MLSRTADNLYWMARYVERAENLARLLEVGYRMARLPDWEKGGYRNEWRSTLAAAGCEASFLERHGEITAEAVIDYVALDADNPSSIYSSLRTARSNARAVRTALTSEMWENLNVLWLEMDGSRASVVKRGDIRGFLEWVKERSFVFRGALGGTMLRDEAYHFTSLGTFVERADSTARILDVKYHVLLPEGENVGGGLDYYQWSTILRSVAALGSYHYLYRDKLKPWMIAELLILREEMPRSLVHCLAQISQHLEALAEAYSDRRECHRAVGKLYSDLRYASIAEIFQGGLHEYLSSFTRQNNILSDEIAASYLFHQ